MTSTQGCSESRRRQTAVVIPSVFLQRRRRQLAPLVKETKTAEQMRAMQCRMPGRDQAATGLGLLPGARNFGKQGQWTGNIYARRRQANRKFSRKFCRKFSVLFFPLKRPCLKPGRKLPAKLPAGWAVPGGGLGLGVARIMESTSAFDTQHTNWPCGV